jgi:putative multiple sugar transport system permease protein
MMNMSVLAALAGMIFVARSTASGPQDGNGWELDAIAAVFIGGAAVSGGIGTVLGSIIGGLIMAFLTNGLQLTGVDADWQSIIKGAVLLLAVGVDVLSKRSGRPSIIGIWSRRRASRVDVAEMPPAVTPTAGTNETSQPADAGRR